MINKIHSFYLIFLHAVGKIYLFQSYKLVKVLLCSRSKASKRNKSHPEPPRKESSCREKVSTEGDEIVVKIHFFNLFYEIKEEGLICRGKYFLELRKMDHGSKGREENDIEIEGGGMHYDNSHNEKRRCERFGSELSDDHGSGMLRVPLLTRNRANTTSQIAIVGANICPIESLDYEYVFFMFCTVIFVFCVFVCFLTVAFCSVRGNMKKKKV